MASKAKTRAKDSRKANRLERRATTTVEKVMVFQTIHGETNSRLGRTLDGMGSLTVQARVQRAAKDRKARILERTVSRHVIDVEK